MEDTAPYWDGFPFHKLQNKQEIKTPNYCFCNCHVFFFHDFITYNQFNILIKVLFEHGTLIWQFSHWLQRVAGPHQLPRNHVENGLDHNQINMNNSFLSGIKQRLLSFIFRSISNEETDKTLVGSLNLRCLFISVHDSFSS